MEGSTVMKTIAGSLTQQPIFDIKEASPRYIPFPTQKTTIRNASFSSYLKPTEESSNPIDDSEISIFDAQKYFNESGSSDPSRRVSPVNANVIGLERISEFSSIPRFSSAPSSVDGYGRNYRARSFHATPTASSEASWNTQTGLLSNPPGAIAISIRNPSPIEDKKRGSATKWLLRRRCPCSGKKSVQVEVQLSEPRTPSRLNHRNCNTKVSLNSHKRPMNPTSPENLSGKSLDVAYWPLENRQKAIPNSRRISSENHLFTVGQHCVVAPTRPFNGDGAANGFTFPILSQAPSPMKLVQNGLPPAKFNHSLEDPPRDSLEVFRPPSEDPTSIKSTTNQLQRRQSFTFPASPKSRMTVTDDDNASDASSDLFEIESFSTQTTSYPMHSNNINHRESLDEASSFNARRGLYYRQSLDEPMTPSITATEFYEPSEASIDWSVTTAEGFDRGSGTNFSVTASEADDMTIMHGSGGRGGGGGCGGKRRGGGGSGLLLSCRCERAVNVGPHPVKCVGRVGQRVVNPTLKHVSSRPGLANKPPLARSHSARLSLPFAT